MTSHDSTDRRPPEGGAHEGGGHHGHVPGHRFSPERWARLVSPERHALLDPARLVERLGVRPGAVVADLGAGPGFFTIPLAERVGATGRVYALDVAPEMVEILRGRLRERGGLPQVVAAASGENELPVPDHVVDVALLAFVLHELGDTRAFLREVARVLAPGGRLAVLEWVPREEEVGPPLHERLSVEQSERLLADAGFAVSERGEANPSNYFVVASPAAAR